MSQACSCKPPKGSVIIPILLMKDEGTVVKSLIQNQMANKGQYRYLGPTIWLLQKSPFLPTVLSRHCLLHQPHPSPSARWLGSAQLCKHSLPLSAPWADALGRSYASQTARQAIPLLRAQGVFYTPQLEHATVYNHLLNHPVPQTVNHGLLTRLVTHTHTCTLRHTGQWGGRWMLSRLTAPCRQ